MNNKLGKSVDVSVVTPMFNEEGCVDAFVNRVTEAMKPESFTYEVIIVNDGSTDQTESKLRAHTKSHPQLKVVNLTRNSGQWAATYAGIQHSSGNSVIIMDGDLQNCPEDIPNLVRSQQEGYELVSGYRDKRKDSKWLRLVPSLIANALLRKVTGCPAKDMGGFKCLDGHIARSLRLRAGQHRFLPALVWLRGGRVHEIKVSSAERFAGKSHYGLSRTFDVLFDMVLFWLQNSFKARPIYLFGRISFWTFVLSSSMFGWSFYQKFWQGIDMGTRPLFFLSIAGYFIAMAFISIGFILEILSDIQNKVTQTLPYYVKDTFGFKNQ